MERKNQALLKAKDSEIKKMKKRIDSMEEELEKVKSE